MQAVELACRVGQGQGSRRVSMAGGDGRLPRRQGSWVEGPCRQSSGSGSRLGLRRQGSSGVISTRMAPMQLEQLLTGKLVQTGSSSRCCCQYVCLTLFQACVQLRANIVQHAVCCLPACVSACLSCLSTCLLVSLSVRLSVCRPVCLSVSVSVSLSVHLSVCLSACLSVMFKFRIPG